MSSAERLEIATTRYETNRDALSINPLSFTAKLATAGAAVELAKLGDEAKGVEAVRILNELVAAFPGYEKVYDDLATALLVAGRPQEALDTLNAHLDVTGHGRNVRVESTYLRALASYQVGQIDEAVQNWRYYVEHHATERYAEAAHRRLADAYAELGNDTARAYHAARAEELGRLRGD